MLSRDLLHIVHLTFPFGIQSLFYYKFQKMGCYSHRERFDFWVLYLMCSLVVSINSDLEKVCSSKEICMKFWLNTSGEKWAKLLKKYFAFSLKLHVQESWFHSEQKKVIFFFCFNTSKVFWSFMLFLLSVPHFETKSVYQIVSEILGIFIRNKSN